VGELTYAALPVISLAVVEHKIDVIKPGLQVLVAALIQLLNNGADVHGVLDQLWVVGEAERLPVDWLPELNCFGVLVDDSHELCHSGMHFFVHFNVLPREVSGVRVGTYIWVWLFLVVLAVV